MCRDENWKVVRPLLRQFIPPPKLDADSVPGLAPDYDQSGGQLAEASPRSRRASEAVAALLNPEDKGLQYMEPQDTYGMRSR